jgi:hypothetical protein
MWHIISSGCDWDSYQKIKVSMISLFRGFNGDADIGIQLLEFKEKFALRFL